MLPQTQPYSCSVGNQKEVGGQASIKRKLESQASALALALGCPQAPEAGAVQQGLLPEGNTPFMHSLHLTGGSPGSADMF